MICSAVTAAGLSPQSKSHNVREVAMKLSFPVRSLTKNWRRQTGRKICGKLCLYCAS
jgi:hypothetical protein